jgi:hypothetical protein
MTLTANRPPQGAFDSAYEATFTQVARDENDRTEDETLEAGAHRGIFGTFDLELMFDAGWKAALAQQAQPDRSGVCQLCNGAGNIMGSPCLCTKYGVPQQAQHDDPLVCEHDKEHGYCYECIAQQAQPEAPATFEQIRDAIYYALTGGWPDAFVAGEAGANAVMELFKKQQ